MIKTYEDWENSLDQNYVRQLSPDAWDLTGSAFEAGQQSQQAKIDELQSRVDAIEKWVNKEKFVPTETWLTEDIVFVDELIDILKGNKDENY